MSIKKTIGTVLVVGALSASCVGAAAANDFVGGGEWDHGVNWAYVWSNYKHSNNHQSTAKGMGEKRSGCTGPHAWSIAKTTRAPFDNQAWGTTVASCLT